MAELVAVVILNYCQSKLTVECLRSLAVQDYKNLAVIVADDSPRDQQISEQQVKEIFPSAHVIYCNENRGFSAGCNPGILKGINEQAEFIWLLNNDTVVKKDTLSLLVEKLHEDIAVGAVGAAIYDMDEKSLQTYGGGRINLDKVYTLPNLSQNVPLDFITGASMLVRTEVLLTTGLLDENFFMYFEDVDLSLRITKAGWKLACVPNAIVLHHGSASLPDSQTGNLYSFFSACYFAKKHSPRIWRTRWNIFAVRCLKPLLSGNIKMLYRLVVKSVRS